MVPHFELLSDRVRSKAPTDGKFDIRCASAARRRGRARVAATGPPRPATCCGRRAGKEVASRCSPRWRPAVEVPIRSRRLLRGRGWAPKGGQRRGLSDARSGGAADARGRRRDAPRRVGRAGGAPQGDPHPRGRSSLPGSAGTGSAGTAPLPPGAGAGAQRFTFDAPPGKLDLRLTVEGASGAGTLEAARTRPSTCRISQRRR